jgi:hypothetical protein
MEAIEKSGAGIDNNTKNNNTASSLTPASTRRPANTRLAPILTVPPNPLHVQLAADVAVTASWLPRFPNPFRNWRERRIREAAIEIYRNSTLFSSMSAAMQRFVRAVATAAKPVGMAVAILMQNSEFRSWVYMIMQHYWSKVSRRNPNLSAMDQQYLQSFQEYL